ncbi:unnamed protein product [Staurois parvus]|uniref:Uncharacterized protein n=1 Tax=Staurois parvus TaxID=386267 RepID=A0ABN9F6W3_9NEOB|nr:unnamed protein product [Staurois parvus]
MQGQGRPEYSECRVQGDPDIGECRVRGDQDIVNAWSGETRYSEMQGSRERPDIVNAGSWETKLN